MGSNPWIGAPSHPQHSNIRDVVARFSVAGHIRSVQPYGTGHINDTYRVDLSGASGAETTAEQRYLLQRINTRVFPNPEWIMDNIVLICRTLHEELRNAGIRDSTRYALTPILTHDGMPYVRDGAGEVWRMFVFIDDTFSLEVVETEAEAYAAAWAFGTFQKQLTRIAAGAETSGADQAAGDTSGTDSVGAGSRLRETIPGFHDTPARLEKLRHVARADPYSRARLVADELRFFASNEELLSRLSRLKASGAIPERAVHNDAKVSNLLFDAVSGEPVCIVDLDTAMPGVAPVDFGELVRSSVASAAEDERCTEKVTVRMPIFEAICRGYLNATHTFLTRSERDNLVNGALTMTCENGMRFLTDFLENNVYYKVAYDEHNLVRCQTQIALAEAIMSRKAELESVVHAEFRRINA